MLQPAVTSNRIVAMGSGALLLCLSSQASATMLYYEPFVEPAYPVTVEGATPNVGGTWALASGLSADTETIVANSMNRTGTLARPTAGGKSTLGSPGDDNARTTSTLTAGVGADHTVVFASMLIGLNDQRVNGVAGFSGIEIRNGGNSVIDIGARALGTLGVVAGNVGTGQVAMPADQVNFLLLRFQFLPGDDIVSVFVNPTPTDLLTNNYDGQLTGGDFSFTNIGLADYNSGVLYGYTDEIRVATTLAEVVVPEPASLTLLGLTTLAALRRRR